MGSQWPILPHLQAQRWPSSPEHPVLGLGCGHCRDSWVKWPGQSQRTRCRRPSSRGGAVPPQPLQLPVRTKARSTCPQVPPAGPPP